MTVSLFTFPGRTFSLASDRFLTKPIPCARCRSEQLANHRRRNPAIAFGGPAARQTRRNNRKSQDGAGWNVAFRYTQGTRSPEPCLRSRWPFLRTRNCLECVVAHPGLREPSIGWPKTIKLHLNNATETRGSDGTQRMEEDCAGHRRSKLNRYGKRLGQVIAVTMVVAQLIAILVPSWPLPGHGHGDDNCAQAIVPRVASR